MSTVYNDHDGHFQSHIILLFIVAIILPISQNYLALISLICIFHLKVKQYFTTHWKSKQGSIWGREYTCCNTSLLSYDNFASYLHRHEYSWVVKIRNTSETVLRPQYTPLTIILALWALVSITAQGSIMALILLPLCFIVAHSAVVIHP